MCLGLVERKAVMSRSIASGVSLLLRPSIGIDPSPVCLRQLPGGPTLSFLRFVYLFSPQI